MREQLFCVAFEPVCWSVLAVLAIGILVIGIGAIEAKGERWRWR